MHGFIPRGFALILIAALAALAATAPAGAATFSNTAPITIPTSGTATPYPSTINVSGVTGAITDVNVTLTGFSHTFPQDVGVLVVGPTGANVVLMGRDGGGFSVNNQTFTFDDSAADSLPCAVAGPLVSGTYKPTDCFPLNHPFDAPAPAEPWGALLSGFNGTDANGTWSLYVMDFVSGDVGSISGGWSLDITVVSPADAIEDLQDTVAGMGLPKGLTTALNSKLQNALDAVAIDDTASACISMRSFQGLVDAQTGKKLTTGQAEQLTDAATAIRAQLGC